MAVPAERVGYLAEIAGACRRHRAFAEEQVDLARDVAHLEGALALVAPEARAGVEQALVRTSLAAPAL